MWGLLSCEHALRRTPTGAYIVFSFIWSQISNINTSPLFFAKVIHHPEWTFNTVSVKPRSDEPDFFRVVTKIQSWTEAADVLVTVCVDRIPGLRQSRAEEEGHVCLFCSPSWTEPLLGRASLSSFFEMCQCGVCVRENGFPSCAQRIFASKGAYTAIGEVGGRGGGGGAVMSVNAATKAITHDKFSTDRGSHRCWETFRLILGTCQPELSSVLTRSMPHRHCVYTSWYRIVTAKPNYSCNFCTYFIGIASRNPMIAIWCRGERSTSHIFARCLTVLKVLHNVRCSHEVRGHWLFFYIVWLHSTLKLNDDNDG